ncbi:MAG TPA: hypothetical protein VFI86_07280 [Burkholderiales bacterium]|nr:hypothetical protein [Burkholderiales bacterium]
MPVLEPVEEPPVEEPPVEEPPIEDPPVVPVDVSPAPLEVEPCCCRQRSLSRPVSESQLEMPTPVEPEDEPPTLLEPELPGVLGVLGVLVPEPTEGVVVLLPLPTPLAPPEVCA